MIVTILIGLIFPITVLILACRAVTSADAKWMRFTGIGTAVFPLFVSALVPIIYWRGGVEAVTTVRFGLLTNGVRLIPSLYLAWWGILSRDSIGLRLASIVVGLVPLIFLFVIWAALAS